MSLPKISRKSHGLTSHGLKATISTMRCEMRYLNKKIFTCLLPLLMASTAMAQQQLIPFVEWKKSNPNWDWGDTSQAAYVGARCSALLLATSSFFTANPINPEDGSKGFQMLISSTTFHVVSERLSRSRGMSDEVISSRKAALLDIYIEKLKENRRLHNNMFHEPILGDVSFCKKTEALYQELHKRY